MRGYGDRYEDLVVAREDPGDRRSSFDEPKDSNRCPQWLSTSATHSRVAPDPQRPGDTHGAYWVQS